MRVSWRSAAVVRWFLRFITGDFAAPEADAYSAHQNTAMRALLTYYWLLLEVIYKSEVDFVADLRCLPQCDDTVVARGRC